MAVGGPRQGRSARTENHREKRGSGGARECDTVVREGEQSDAFKAHLGQSVLYPRRLGSGEELAFMVMELLTNPYMNAEVIRVDGGIRMPPK